jgi:hypothetical protein
VSAVFVKEDQVEPMCGNAVRSCKLLTYMDCVNGKQNTMYNITQHDATTHYFLCTSCLQSGRSQ